MIAEGTPVAFVPCRDPARSRGFYEETLGLELMAEDAFALTFDAGGTPLRLTRVAEHRAPAHTLFGWEVDDLDEAVAELTKRSIEPVRTEGLEQDDRGIWTAPDGTRVVWFTDPDGNILSISEAGE